MCVLAASLSTAVVAQEKFELGKPNNSNYRYLDDFQALKNYINYEKYPNFKLGIGTTVNDYFNNTTFRNLVNKNFTETVAGNAMKMGSCVDGSGNMNFDNVKRYVKAATEAGLHVYGHTLAWHSQQPNAWLRSLVNGKSQQERHDTLVYAMDKWIKGMMEACEGKVKAWDLVNEAIAGDGNDGTRLSLAMATTAKATMCCSTHRATRAAHGMWVATAFTGRTIWAISTTCAKPAD